MIKYLNSLLTMIVFGLEFGVWSYHRLKYLYHSLSLDGFSSFRITWAIVLVMRLNKINKLVKFENNWIMGNCLEFGVWSLELSSTQTFVSSIVSRWFPIFFAKGLHLSTWDCSPPPRVEGALLPKKDLE